MLGAGPSMTAELIPALATSLILRLTSSPRGSHPEASRWSGWGRRLRPGLHPGPGRLREPPWGYYGPCARSSLGGSGRRVPGRGAGDEAMSRADPQNLRHEAARPEKRGPQFSNRRRAERHGACGGWLNPSAPRPGSTEAADTPAPRGAPLPLMTSAVRERGRGFRLGENRAASLLPLREKVAARSADG